MLALLTTGDGERTVESICSPGLVARGAGGFLCLFVLATAMTPVFAEVRKGYIEVGFAAGLNWGQSDSHYYYEDDGDPLNSPVIRSESENWSIGGSGHAGYFISDRIDVGGTLRLHYGEGEQRWGMESLESSSYSWSIGPSINYHFTPRSHVVPFVGAALGISQSKREGKRSSALGSLDETQDGWFALGRAGADFFVNPHVAIKLGLEYVKTEYDTDIDGATSTLRREEVSWDNVSLFVGLSIFLH